MNYLGNITLEPGERELIRTPVMTNAEFVLLLMLSGILTVTTKRLIFFGEEPDAFLRKDKALRSNFSIAYDDIQEIKKYSRGNVWWSEPEIELLYRKNNGEVESVYFSIAFFESYRDRRSTPYMSGFRNREEARATFLLLKEMAENKDFRKGVQDNSITTIDNYPIPHLRDLERMQMAIPKERKKLLREFLVAALIAVTVVAVLFLTSIAIWMIYIR